MAMQTAVVPGADIVLTSTIGYNQAARASHSATSFKTVMSTKFENMIQSAEKRLEVAMLYGQDSLGTFALQTCSIANSQMPMIVDTAAWATGIWAGAENGNYSFVTNDGVNTAVDSLRSFALVGVNPDTRTLTFAAGTAGTAGTLATLQTAIEAGALKIFYFGAVSGSTSTFAYAEQAGLKVQISNAATSFGISAATYDLWRGNTAATTGQMTMGKLLSFVSKPVQRGLKSKVSAFCNPSTWADLAGNLAALRRFDGSYNKKKGENGQEKLVYYSQNGEIEMIAYNLIKEGDMIVFPEDKVKRIGARELSLNDPTRPSDQIFFTIPGIAGVGVRAYTNQAIFLDSPCQALYVSGIVNSLV